MSLKLSKAVECAHICAGDILTKWLNC